MQEANVLELLPGQTWDTVTSQLRSYDRAGNHLRKEYVHLASPVICNLCHTVGHKSPDCPQNAMRGGKGRGRQFRGGKGGGGKGARGGGRGYQGKGGWKPKTGRGKSQGGRVCFCCRSAGHQAQHCPHAQEFSKTLEKRKDNNSQGNQVKRNKPPAADEDYGEYSFMLSHSAAVAPHKPQVSAQLSQLLVEPVTAL